MKSIFFNPGRFKAIIIKEFIQIKRDPISLRLAFIMPVALMFLLGYAIKVEVDEIPTAVFDQSKTQESRDYIQKFIVSQYFMVERNVDSREELTRMIDGGIVRAGLIIPTDFAREIKRNRSPQTQIMIDGSDATTARTAMAAAALISAEYSAGLRQSFTDKHGISLQDMPGVSLSSKVWYNPSLENKNFTIPGQLGIIIQNITIMLTAFALVREKERGTIEQLIVTPIMPAELILGKIVPYVGIAYASFLLSLGMCVFWFKVEIAGSVFLLMVLALLFILCCLSIGMLVSTVVQNQLQAMLLMIVALLSSVILSGFIFPREAMPAAISAVGSIWPVTYFLRILRGIILKGVGVGVLLPDILILTGFTVVLIVFATFRVRKSLD